MGTWRSVLVVRSVRQGKKEDTRRSAAGERVPLWGTPGGKRYHTGAKDDMQATPPRLLTPPPQVLFHDASRFASRVPLMTDYYGFDRAALGDKGVLYSSPPTRGSGPGAGGAGAEAGVLGSEPDPDAVPGMLMFRPFEQWAPNGEWTAALPTGEEALCLAVGESLLDKLPTAIHLLLHSLHCAESTRNGRRRCPRERRHCSWLWVSSLVAVLVTGCAFSIPGYSQIRRTIAITHMPPSLLTPINLPLAVFVRPTYRLHLCCRRRLPAGSTFVAAATSRQLLRLFSLAGSQTLIARLDGPPVAMAAAGSVLMVVWHSGGLLH